MSKLRKFQEVLLKDVPVAAAFWVDGAKYTRLVAWMPKDIKDTRITAVLETEFYASKSEIDDGMPLLFVGDRVLYRADLVVLVEIE